MKTYLSDWKVIQGTLNLSRVMALPECAEKDHLHIIREMLVMEDFNPDEFFVHEYPTDGVYVCCQANQENYFTIQELEGKLVPYYVTEKCDEHGFNNFPCKTIKESIDKTEC